MTIISSPIDIEKIPISVAIIVAAVLIALAIVVEPLVTDRGRFVPSAKNHSVVYDTRTGCMYYLQLGRYWCP
jgi:hypothetical protein